MASAPVIDAALVIEAVIMIEREATNVRIVTLAV
jgi:hypothetical protein